MHILNSPILTMALLSAFAILAQYSQQQGYTAKERAAMDRLVIASAQPATNADIIMDAWGITEKEINQPVNIFGE